jgi:hypothetical protein
MTDEPTLDDLKAKAERERAARSTTRAAAPPKPTRADRAGMVLIAGYFPPATRKALKHLAIEQDKTLQQVMADAFAAHLAHHVRHG